MVPGEYSALRIPTISGRAWAAVDIKMPAPMVAASAAILNDIAFSTSKSPNGGQIARKLRERRFAGLTYANLTASLNRLVSKPAGDLISVLGTKEMLQTK
jgi:hypothetical protein